MWLFLSLWHEQHVPVDPTSVQWCGGQDYRQAIPSTPKQTAEETTPDQVRWPKQYQRSQHRQSLTIIKQLPSRHVTKVLQILILAQLRPQAKSSLDPQQFAHRTNVEAITYILQGAYCHLDSNGCTVRITFFDFASAFNTISSAATERESTGNVRKHIH